MANLPNITSAIGSGTTILAAVPQVAGLFGNQTSQTIGYQPELAQGGMSPAAANILGSSNSILNQLFNPLPAMLFHYEGEQTVIVEADVTDHYVEDNTAVQDQIALKPAIITTLGFIGELNDVPPNKAFQVAQIAANKLTAIAGYAPGLSVTALQAYNLAFQLYQTGANALSAAVSAYNSLGGDVAGESVVVGGQLTQVAGSQNSQQTAFQQFLGYQSTRTLFTVQTPWAVFPHCTILSLKAVQDPDTQMISSFSVTFKQMRFVADLSPTSSTTGLGRFAAQSATPANNGTSVPTTSPTTFDTLYKALA